MRTYFVEKMSSLSFSRNCGNKYFDLMKYHGIVKKFKTNVIKP